jgi:hypothetical protein
VIGLFRQPSTSRFSERRGASSISAPGNKVRPGLFARDNFTDQVRPPPIDNDRGNTCVDRHLNRLQLRDHAAL